MELLEKERDEKMAEKQKSFDRLYKDWNETYDELAQYKQIRSDVIDANKQQVKKIEEKDTTVSDLEK